MKISKFLLAAIIFLSFGSPVNSQDLARHQLSFSFTLSGHLLFGLGYTYWLDHQQAIQVTAFPLIVPGEGGRPFAFNAGYGYYSNTEPWRFKAGLELTCLVSPPDPEKRKVLLLLNAVPGVQYDFGQNSVLSQIWISYFLNQAKGKVFPTGLEFRYGRQLDE